ncbi:hypothetical protein [Chitiniphilus eburneus]|uniref:Uncharacterized protein n=1 Tax=Chitiniphilus eburneus TaxID=2571148 RepID=A0A4U0PNG2_9NEIS|nr:hypothetical protein [Chitiniphilus eburneus]TJZ69746.1 hypothetical protein FAZ21_14605 [Chitiniphilus eburneus]
MKIQEQDQFHGAALTQIVEHLSFKALNRASEKYGHYLVNTDRHVFAKYSTATHSPWSFSFKLNDLEAIQAEIDAQNIVFLCLVCGTTTVCALNEDEFSKLIDLRSPTSQWIRVEVPLRGSCHVSGSLGALKHTVPHNSFPVKVFA